MHIAVVLSGCGVFDGSEIHEAVLTLLSLSQAGATYQCLAPDILQPKTINHLTHEEEKSPRNMLVEAARIARGNILPLSKANAADYDAVIFPGGLGAAQNLSDFLSKGEHARINPEVLSFANHFKAAQKPAGFICIAPSLIPLIYPKGTRFTIGNDAGTAQKIESMGGIHVVCKVDEIAVDTAHKVVSTPAYMLAQNISEAASGIQKLVQEVLRLAQH